MENKVIERWPLKMSPYGFGVLCLLLISHNACFGAGVQSANGRPLGQASDSAQELRRDMQDRPNVLLIVIDDLNDWISILGHPTVKTPNFERLAKRSVTFNNAFCPAMFC